MISQFSPFELASFLKHLYLNALNTECFSKHLYLVCWHQQQHILQRHSCVRWVGHHNNMRAEFWSTVKQHVFQFLDSDGKCAQGCVRELIISSRKANCVLLSSHVTMTLQISFIQRLHWIILSATTHIHTQRQRGVQCFVRGHFDMLSGAGNRTTNFLVGRWLLFLLSYSIPSYPFPQIVYNFFNFFSKNFALKINFH